MYRSWFFEDNLSEYKNAELGFSFKYSKEFGNYEEQFSSKTNRNLYFKNTYDDISLLSLSLSIKNNNETEKDYISSQNENSSGDYNPYISGAGWKTEKLLIEKNKDGYIPCLSNKDGVYRALLCEIKTIGNNKFLVKYSRDSYKGESTIKQYVIYNKDMRYEFGGGKGLSYYSYFSCEEFPDYPNCGIQDYKELSLIATTENLKNHKLNNYEILVEEMLKTLTFN